MEDTPRNQEQSNNQSATTKSQKSFWSKLFQVGKYLALFLIVFPIIVILVPWMTGDTLLVSVLSPELKKQVSESGFSASVFDEIKRKEITYNNFLQQRTFEGNRSIFNEKLVSDVSITTSIYNDITFYNILEILHLNKLFPFIKCDVFSFGNEIYCTTEFNKINGKPNEVVTNLHSNNIGELFKNVANKIIEKNSPYHYFFYNVANRDFEKAIEISNTLLRIKATEEEAKLPSFFINRFYTNLMRGYSLVMQSKLTERNNLQNNDNISQAFVFMDTARKIFNERRIQKDTMFKQTEEINLEFYFGYFFIKTNQFDKAIEHFNTVIKILEKNKLIDENNENHINFIALLYNDIAFCEYCIPYYKNRKERKRLENAVKAINFSKSKIEKYVNCQNCISEFRQLKSINNTYNTTLTTIAEIYFAKSVLEEKREFWDSTKFYLNRSINFGFVMDTTTFIEYPIYYDIFHNPENQAWGKDFVRTFFPIDTTTYKYLYKNNKKSG